jgi:hypothetical protein
VTRNARDSTLKIWPKVSYRGRPALGVTGLNANRLGQYRDKLCQVTMTTDVRKSHYLTPHLKSTRFVAMLCCLTFPECHPEHSGENLPVAADRNPPSEILRLPEFPRDDGSDTDT